MHENLKQSKQSVLVKLKDWAHNFENKLIFVKMVSLSVIMGQTF